MTNYNDGKWHGWNGGECPVHPQSLVEWVADTGQPYAGKGHAGKLTDLKDTSRWNRIVAFRVVREHREPREFWADLLRQIIYPADADRPQPPLTIKLREVL